MQGKRISPYVRLEELWLGPEGQIARREDEVMRTPGPSQTITIITLPDPRLSRIGALITDTDRELRRAVTILGGGTSGFGVGAFTVGAGPGVRPRPISSLDGGLWISDAEAGSLHFIAAPFGMLMNLLLSRPVSAFVTTLALWGSAGQIRTWRSRRKDPLEGITARQALEVLKAFNGNANLLMSSDPPPNLDLEISPTLVEESGEDLTLLEDDPAQPIRVAYSESERESAELRRERESAELKREMAELRREMAELRRERVEAGEEIPQPHEAREPRPAMVINGVGQTGRRITHIRQHPDGTQDIIYIEG
jgi:hypothetical protein